MHSVKTLKKLKRQHWRWTRCSTSCLSRGR